MQLKTIQKSTTINTRVDSINVATNRLIQPQYDLMLELYNMVDDPDSLELYLIEGRKSTCMAVIHGRGEGRVRLGVIATEATDNLYTVKFTPDVIT